jgi:hypothetical protein
MAGLGTWAIGEALALKSEEEGDTISAITHDVITSYPVVAGLIVATTVHFCTPTRKGGEPLPWWQGSTVAMIGGAMLGAGWARYDPSRPKKK